MLDGRIQDCLTHLEATEVNIGWPVGEEFLGSRDVGQDVVLRFAFGKISCHHGEQADFFLYQVHAVEAAVAIGFGLHQPGQVGRKAHLDQGDGAILVHRRESCVATARRRLLPPYSGRR